MKRLGAGSQRSRRMKPSLSASARAEIGLTFRGKSGDAIRKRTRSWVRSMVEPDIRLPPSKSRPFTSIGKKATQRLDSRAERALQAGPVPLPLVPGFMFEAREALFSGDPTATSRPQTRELRSAAAVQDGSSSPLSPLYGSMMSSPSREARNTSNFIVTPGSPVSHRGEYS